MPANIGAIADHAAVSKRRLHCRDGSVWLEISLMDETGNEIATPRMAAGFQSLVLSVLVCCWHGTAVGRTGNTDQRPLPGLDLLTTAVVHDRQFGVQVQERDHRGKFVPAIGYAGVDRAVLADWRVPRAGHRFAGPADPFIPVTLIEIKPAPGFGLGLQPEGRATEAAALIRNKEYDKALALATQMTLSSPDDPSGYNLQGTAYLGKKDWANARRSFEKALKVHPDDAIALANIAQIDIKQKDTASARKRFQAILAKDGTDVPAMLGLAQLEFLKGDNNAGLGWLEKAKVARPKAVDPRLSIAAYYMRRKNFTQAIGELTEATDVIPDNADILDLLGQAQLANG